jgi:translation initiation factor 3 subunit F
MPAKTLLLPSAGSPVVKIHPVVLFSICDAYIRRNDKQERVIGTLMGVVSDHAIEVKNCYVVPHNESSETVAIDIAHHKTMYDLHHRVASHEVILGWFSTGSTLFNSDALIQDFYAKEAANAIHLVVDTTLTDKQFNIKAFICRNLSLGDRQLASQFVETPCEVLSADLDKLGIDMLSVKDKDSTKPLTEADTLSSSLQHLTQLLDKAATYVDDVMAGRAAGDTMIGRYLADTLAVVPHFSKMDFERLFNDNVQDMMMVTYLSNLLRSHIALAEKLGTSALPIL